jgi:hypothetical protein
LSGASSSYFWASFFAVRASSDTSRTSSLAFRDARKCSKESLDEKLDALDE